MPCTTFDMSTDSTYSLEKRINELEHQLCAIRTAILTGNTAEMIRHQVEHELKPGCMKPTTRTFRWHRGGLHESLKTSKKFDGSAEELVHLLRQGLDRFPSLDGKVTIDTIKVEKYGDGIDMRCGWDTYIVTIPEYGVAGFTDGPLLKRLSRDADYNNV